MLEHLARGFCFYKYITSFDLICLLQPPSSSVLSDVSPSLVSDTSSSSHLRSTIDKPVGPKCGACGQVGHNKNSKICPHYFSEEAIQRREVF